MPPGSMDDESDYLPPYDPTKVVVHRSRRFCQLPKPKRDGTLHSHVAAERNRLYRWWVTGVGWDRRALHYALTPIIRRVWSELQNESFMGYPLVHRLLRRARVRDPYVVESGAWAIRKLTAKEMRRVVECAARMRAEKALARET